MAKLYIGDSQGAPAIVKIEEVPKFKFGASVDTWIGDLDANGVLKKPTTSFVFDMSGCTTLKGNYLMRQKFRHSTCAKAIFPDLKTIADLYICEYMFSESFNLTEVDLSNLETINGTYCCYSMFSLCYSLSKVNLKKLTTIQGTYCCNTMFSGNDLIEIDLDNLETINGNSACANMFRGCSELKTVKCSKLTTVEGTNACASMFEGCKIERVDFPSLVAVNTDSAFGNYSSNGIFNDCMDLTEIHFRRDVEGIISSLKTYQYKFGATNATIYFDL